MQQRLADDVLTDGRWGSQTMQPVKQIHTGNMLLSLLCVQLIPQNPGQPLTKQNTSFKQGVQQTVLVTPIAPFLMILPGRSLCFPLRLVAGLDRWAARWPSAAAHSGGWYQSFGSACACPQWPALRTGSGWWAPAGRPMLCAECCGPWTCSTESSGTSATLVRCPCHCL